MLNVKNTMLSYAAGLLAPHLCVSCGNSGDLLCEGCVYDITDHSLGYCMVCRQLTSGAALCGGCREPYARAWCVGEYKDTLKQLVIALKFERTAQAARDLAKLLDCTIDILPDDTIVTSIPTHPTHIRRRGYDHARLLARDFALRRGLTYRDLLVRRSFTEQRGAGRNARFIQADHAYVASLSLKSKHVLLIDDVFTTGATVRSGALALKKAGASSIWAAVAAYQPPTK